MTTASSEFLLLNLKGLHKSRQTDINNESRESLFRKGRKNNGLSVGWCVLDGGSKQRALMRHKMAT